MAKRTYTVLTCDLCDAEGVTTAVLNGYSIDLCESHSKPLEAYAGKGSKVAAPKGAARTTAPSKGNVAVVRQWAKDNGYEVKDRGRIHQDIWDAYNKANES